MKNVTEQQVVQRKILDLTTLSPNLSAIEKKDLLKMMNVQVFIHAFYFWILTNSKNKSQFLLAVLPFDEDS